MVVQHSVVKTQGCKRALHVCIRWCTCLYEAVGWVSACASAGESKKRQQQLISLALSMARLSAAFHFAPNELPDGASESDDCPPASRVCASGARGSVVIRCPCCKVCGVAVFSSETWHHDVK